MDQFAGWLAPLATMIAAVMTAANLGTRVTGWGFVVLTVGALAWCAVALTSHQPNLLWSNAFLAIVDAIGIYRWLGRRALLEDGANRAARISRRRGKPLFPVHTLEGRPVAGADGFVVAHVVGAMADCRTGRIRYFVVRRGGIAEGDQLRAIAWRDMVIGNPLRTTFREGELAASPPISPDDWPQEAPRIGATAVFHRRSEAQA
ncbi:photosystem reaction center subunit H [Nostoc sp. 3335mG]|nr:photosystem reaction center subunit H [Nostoc sp. 3335mG]